jgi:hypothetical protein
VVQIRTCFIVNQSTYLFLHQQFIKNCFPSGSDFSTNISLLLWIRIRSDPDPDNYSEYAHIRIRPVYNYFSSVVDPDTVGSGIIFWIRILNYLFRDPDLENNSGTYLSTIITEVLFGAKQKLFESITMYFRFSVVDPDPVGSGIICRIRIRN